MKKEYIKPSSNVYKISPIQIVAESSGTTIDNNPGTLDYDVEDSRENNILNNNNSVWDNAW